MNNINLNGLRVLNTRPQNQNQQLTAEIRAHGGVVIELPTIKIEPIIPSAGFIDLPTYQQVIFTSTNAVRYGLPALLQNDIVQKNLQHKTWPATIHTIAVGPATAKALSNANIHVHDIATPADSEHVLQLQSLQQIQQQNILLIQGCGGRQLIKTSLQKRGARVQIFTVYQRTLPTTALESLRPLWQQNAVDIILYTSHESMQNLFTMLGFAAHTWLCDKPSIVISQRLHTAAQSLGLKTVFVCNHDEILKTLSHLASIIKVSI